MTLVRLGFVAMSTVLENCSPSQTMTYTNFQKLADTEAAIHRLERIALSNIENCLRLLKHCSAHDVKFFRLSSKLVPLATHEALKGWDYIHPIAGVLKELGSYAENHGIRIDFHPDQFHVINTPNEETFKATVKGLNYFRCLIDAMGIDPRHRLVLHVGGAYGEKELALERFITNWALLPAAIQSMVMLENDDKSFSLDDTLYLCEKLGVPLVFDYHHHLANHADAAWEQQWERVLATWDDSPLPIKMHISSPKSERQFRHHADYINPDLFIAFLDGMKGSVGQIDCMIESKQKDQALFQLVKDLKRQHGLTFVDEASFIIH